MGDKAKSAGIFNECTVSFVPGTLLTPSAISELAAAVKDNGGEVYEPRRDGSLRLDEATHIISNTIDFPQYAESQAFMIPVVTAEWITMSLARRRQAIVRPYSPDPRLIFSSLVVTCADLPLTDKESIIGATLAMGGSESKDVNRTTTHICALSMDHPKVKAAVDAKLKAKIVLPHWFDDCFKLGKRIDEGPYLLPDPEILNTPADASLIVPTNESLIGATSPNPTNLPIPPDSDSVRPPCTVFQDKRVMISWDVVTSSRQRLMKVVEQVIVNGGGKMVDEVEDCDIFICHYRDGPHYVQAAQSCKDVGNLAWLYHLIVHNEWTSPFKRLLHYPIPKDGIEGFKNMRITVSNYGGEARIYLESLIKACGAEYTRTMKQDNTHLVTARDTSEKCIVAPEWGISVINHLWLEESYAKCEIKPLTIKKYTHFPPRTNLGEIIGQTSMDESRLRALYYPGGEDKMSIDAKTRRKILDVADENTYGYGPGEGILKTRAEVDRDSFDIMRNGNGNGAEPKTKSRKSKTATTPVRPDRVSSGKENTTPSMSTGDRSAKAKARDKLQHIAPDIALYEKEKKRHSKSGPWGGKRAADTAEKEKDKDTKRPATHDAEDEDEDEEEAKRPAKKARPSLPAVEMRVVLTGYTRWVGSRKKEDTERRKLRNLGIQIVPEGSPCDYVAAPQIIRTVKFICALARGATAISSDFITAVIEAGELLTPEDYPLKDTENEKKYDIKLTKSVARAKAHRGRLLWSVAVYCTDKIRNGPESYRSVAEANGAIFKLYRARSGTTIRPTTEEEDGGRAPEPVYLLSSMSSEEKAMWPRFKEMAEKGHMEPRVVAPDWLLDVAMAQEVRFDEKFLVENFYAE